VHPIDGVSTLEISETRTDDIGTIFVAIELHSGGRFWNDTIASAQKSRIARRELFQNVADHLSHRDT
jgi:hypothetical protein